MPFGYALNELPRLHDSKSSSYINWLSTKCLPLSGLIFSFEVNDITEVQYNEFQFSCDCKARLKSAYLMVLVKIAYFRFWPGTIRKILEHSRILHMSHRIDRRVSLLPKPIDWNRQLKRVKSQNGNKWIFSLEIPSERSIEYWQVY